MSFLRSLTDLEIVVLTAENDLIMHDRKEIYIGQLRNSSRTPNI